MAKKYILFDDATIAQERCHAARERMNPNRRALQLAAHEKNPPVQTADIALDANTDLALDFNGDAASTDILDSAKPDGFRS